MADRIGTLDSVLGRYGLSTADLMPLADGERPAPTVAPARKSASALDLNLEDRRRKLRLTNSETEALLKRAAEVPPAATPAPARRSGPPPSRTPEQDRRVCRHEPGHAVVSLALGGRLELVTVDPEGRDDGSVSESALTGYRRLVMIYAGGIADGYGLGGGTGGDYDQAHEISQDGQTHRQAEEDARRLLVNNSHAVNRLATELATRRTLTGAEAAAVCGPVYR